MTSSSPMDHGGCPQADATRTGGRRVPPATSDIRKTGIDSRDTAQPVRRHAQYPKSGPRSTAKSGANGGADRVLFVVKGFAGSSLNSVSVTGQVCAGWRAVGWVRAREWLVRRAGAGGVG